MIAPRMYYGLDWNPGYGDTFAGVPVLVSAGVCWYTTRDDWFGVMTLPEDLGPVFMDSGGFQATTRWDLSYPYTIGAYFNLAEQVGADYVAGPDFACEPDLHHSSVNERILHTAAQHRTAKRIYDTGNWSFQFVPVLQGYEPEDYARCCRLYQEYGLSADYMAIGTVCKRRNPDAIHRCLTVCEDHYPEAEWHLFGLTLDAWKDRRLWGRFKSADTAAWNWGCSTTAEKKEAARDYQDKVNEIRRDMGGQQTLEDSIYV